MTEQNGYEQKPLILIVEDAPENIALLSSLLKPLYRLKVATDGRKAMEIASSDGDLDLILLDVVMPEMDGYEVCRRLKAQPTTAEIPVIFLTARSSMEDEQIGLELGAVDYVNKPINPPVLAARVHTHIQLKRARDFLKDKNEYLAQEVLRRTHEIETIQDVTLVAMGSLAETRDNETGNHIRRTQHYVRRLAEALRSHPRFAVHLRPAAMQLIYKSAPLHDIGKVGIPDNILLKPAKLTDAEFAVMRTHTTLGRDAILAAERILDTPQSFLAVAREIAWTHHEKWDGSGYPRGLAGEAIPVAGRIMAVADVYDALISKRVYKPAMPHDAALSIIREGAGSHFDRIIVEAFLDISDEIRRVVERFFDTHPKLEPHPLGADRGGSC